MNDKSNSPQSSDQQEASQIKKDLFQVLALNSLFFAGLIALYYFNRSTGKVDEFFSHFLRF